MRSTLNYSYIFLFIFSAIALTMCKSDVKSNASPEEKVDRLNSINLRVDSSQVNFDQMEEFHFVSMPYLYRWNRMGQSLIQLDKNPEGYVLKDTISWIHPSGKSFMSMSYAEASTYTLDVDYKMFYERVRMSYPYEDYSYNKFDANGTVVHEIKLSNDSISTYKLLIPKGKELIQIDVLSHAKDFNEEISKTIDQLPGLVKINN